MITPEQRAHFLREVRSGASRKLAASVAGIPRSSLYAALNADPSFACDLSEAREGTHPAPEISGEDQTPVGADLSVAQAAAFCKEIYRHRNVRLAAISAHVDLDPDRLRPVDMTPRQRELTRAFLDAITAPEPAPPPTPRELAQQALAEWLKGQPFPADVDVDELKALSPRAAVGFEQQCLVREAERAAHGEPDEPAE